MKKRYTYKLGILLLLFVLSSCENLDLQTRTTLSLDQILNNYGSTQGQQAAVYQGLMEGFTDLGGAMLASATDEAEHTLETTSIQKFNVGSWNAYDNPDDVWAKYFRAIRLANNYLAYADVPRNLDLYKLDPSPTQQLVYNTRVAEMKRWKYEVRFLRAFFYFELVKRYGGVPILKSEIFPNDNFSGLKRNTLAECISFINTECDSAANNLPVNYAATPTDLGRITKGAALSLKCRSLLYAASDLFNKPASGYARPELVSMPTGDRIARWQAAADAAQAVMNLAATAPYSLSTDYRGLFRTFNNNEIIFTRRNTANNSFEIANYPIGFDRGQSGTTPSQNLVDAYEVKVDANTAVPFDWNNPVHAANPYAPVGTLGRDPRLGMNIITNSSSFKARPVECWTGGKDGKGVTNATKTGYYLKKYVDENLNLLTGTTSVHSWIYFRYAEILLNYAEALNEAQGPVAGVYANVNAVRARSGVAMPPLPVGLSQSQMRDRIRNERRVEFAFEEQRPWDVRRWMQGETYFNVPLRGVSIALTVNGFTYSPNNVENRKFESKMYFYPIPQSELNIFPEWIQNPGW